MILHHPKGAPGCGNVHETLRHYLLGRHFLLCTDHASLRWLVNFRKPEGMAARWIQCVETFDYEVQNRQGKAHGNADALSRWPGWKCKRENCPQCQDALDPDAGVAGAATECRDASVRSCPTQVQVPQVSALQSGRETDTWVDQWTQGQLRE